MLSRIARGLYTLGREVERAQNVVRILEVNHKMNLEHTAVEGINVWLSISEAFATGLGDPDERSIYEALVLSAEHPYSARRCLCSARDRGRAMRDHVSEEMWLHLNANYHALADLKFESILRLGRSEFNRRIETFCDAFHGLADDTMIRGDSWHFLRLGKFVERAGMVCRILEIKRKAISLAPHEQGRPVDFHQWQALLRSLSGYEPYRRAYDARVVPARVLEFVLQREEFPRSLAHAVSELGRSLQVVASDNPAQHALERSVRDLREELAGLDVPELIGTGSFESTVQLLHRRCAQIEGDLEQSFFSSLRPTPPPIRALPGAALVPQQ
jgi:uncharacterized alpha-E superfamily protein